MLRQLSMRFKVVWFSRDPMRFLFVRWGPPGSNEICLIRWVLLGSIGIHLDPLGSAGIRWNPLGSAGFVGIRWYPLGFGCVIQDPSFKGA